jgi:hypothetical protein
MRTVRGLLVIAGVGFGLWGLWLMRGFTSDQLISAVTWLAGGVILHDAVLAPVTVLLGVAAARLLPRQALAIAAIAFLVWATVTVAVANVLIGQGGKPDNDTVLDRPYVLSWFVFTGLLAGAALIVAGRRRRETRMG